MNVNIQRTVSVAVAESTVPNALLAMHCTRELLKSARSGVTYSSSPVADARNAPASGRSSSASFTFQRTCAREHTSTLHA